MSKWTWRKILVGTGAGLISVSAVVPVVNLVTLPAIGAVTLGQAVFWAGTFCTGWATKSPGAIPAEPTPPPKE